MNNTLKFTVQYGLHQRRDILHVSWFAVLTLFILKNGVPPCGIVHLNYVQGLKVSWLSVGDIPNKILSLLENSQTTVLVSRGGMCRLIESSPICNE